MNRLSAILSLAFFPLTLTGGGTRRQFSPVTQALHENKHLTEDHLCQQPPRLPRRQCAPAFWFV
jgi:hypothetical protein